MTMQHPTILRAAVALLLLPAGAMAQSKGTMPAECAALNDPSVDHAAMDHSAHSALLAKCSGPLPTGAGQAAFGTISEVVRILQADPKTDWSKVNIEALRQHLIDMDDVVMRSEVVQRNVTGGVELTVTGTGRVVGAIRRMAVAHTSMLAAESSYSATAMEVPNGARLTIAARNADAAMTARIRGLGFAGLLTEGNHHAPHHLALARGENPHGK